MIKYIKLKSDFHNKLFVMIKNYEQIIEKMKECEGVIDG